MPKPSYVLRITYYALRSPLLYLCLLLSALLWSAAWQTKAVYNVKIGGYQDDPYVYNFFDREHRELDYRWSRDVSVITIPGLGNVPVDITLNIAGGRPAALGLPAPEIVIMVRDQEFKFQTQDGLADYTFQAKRGDALDGNLRIEIHAPPFDPPNDGRHGLGVTVTGVTVTPVIYALSPWVVPPPDHLGLWSASFVILFLLAALVLGSVRGAALVASGGSVVVAGLIVWSRPELGFLAPQAPVLLLWALALAISGLFLGGAVLRLTGSANWRAAAAVAGAWALGFLLRFGGMTYPQFESSDILLHVHNIEKILHGTWVWMGQLPDNTNVPYPPGLYVLLAPFAGLVLDLTLLLRFALSVIDAATVFPLLYLGVVLFRSARAGAWAAWVYVLLPAAFLLFSPGNYSNLFAQFTFVLALAALLRVLTARAAGWGVWLMLGGATLLTFLSHYGMLVAAGVVAGFVLLAGLFFGDGLTRQRVLQAGGVLALALVVAFAVYYRNFVPEITAQIQASLSKIGGGSGQSDGLAANVLRTLGAGIGGVPLLAALLGWGVAPPQRRLRRMLPLFAAAYLLADLVVAVLTVAAGDNTRYVLLLAPVAALGAGSFAARLALRGVAGRCFAVVAVILLLWQLLDAWVHLIFYYRPFN